MHRESDDNMSSIASTTFTDLYQETVKRFTRSSLSPEIDRFSTLRHSTKSPTTSYKPDADRRSIPGDLYLEATGRRRSSDQGTILTVNTDQFIIGQRVWVGGIRPGQIAYIGETHFAPGDWAGIVLDEPNGKNDGCVAGKRYFQCEPKRGIFSRLTRLTMVPLPGASAATSPILKYSPDRSRTVSPTTSVRSSFLRSPSKAGLTLGDRVIVSSGLGSRVGILRYIGQTQFASGNWCGVELDEPTGKNDGSVDGFKYFDVKPNHGIFVPIAKVSLSPSAKKTRLSRTGSRESLTSVGTMNSIATTNTSRMRMNAQQRKSSSAFSKPVTPTKSQFSMQDLLREKATHIEQLIKERELDREDAHNQAAKFQKNLSEFRDKIEKLEKELSDERKKNEELQASVDEATFCGDELNAQLQVYKEKVQELEDKFLPAASDALPNNEQQLLASTAKAVDDAAQKQLFESELAKERNFFEQRLAEEKDTFDNRLAALLEEEKRLRENITYLQKENESMQNELLEKDASIEKISLSMNGRENLREEIARCKQQHEDDMLQSAAEFERKLCEKNEEVLLAYKNYAALQETNLLVVNEHANCIEEMQEARRGFQEQFDLIKADCEKMDVDLKTKATIIQEHEERIEQQNETILQESVRCSALEAQLGEKEADFRELQQLNHSMQEQLSSHIERHTNLEHQLESINLSEQSKMDLLVERELVNGQLRSQLSAISSMQNDLHAELKLALENCAAFSAAEESARKDLEQQKQTNNLLLLESETSKHSATALSQELNELKVKMEKSVKKHVQELSKVQDSLVELQKEKRSLKEESVAKLENLSARIGQISNVCTQMEQSLQQSAKELNEQRDVSRNKDSELNEKNNSLRAIEQELANSKCMREDLQREHTAILQKCADLEDATGICNQQLAKLSLELSDNSRHLQSKTQKCEDLEKNNEELNKQLLTLRQTCAELQSEIKANQLECSLLQKQLNEQLEQHNEERAQYELKNEELQQKVSNAAQDMGELKLQLQKQKDELVQKCSQITEMEEQNIKHQLKLTAATRQQENLQAKCQALTEQNESLQRDLAALRDSSTDSGAELLKLSQDVAAKQKAYDELVDKTHAEHTALDIKLQASMQRVDVLCNQAEMLTAELNSATSLNVDRCNQLKTAQDHVCALELELNDLKRKFETSNTKCESLEKQKLSIQAELNTARVNFADASNSILKMTDDLNAKQKEWQDLRDENNRSMLALQSQVQDLTQRLSSAQNELDSTRKELHLLQAEREKDVEAAAKEKAEIQFTLMNDMEMFRKISDEEIERLKNQSVTQNSSSEAEKLNLHETIHHLQAEVEMLNKEVVEKQQQLEAKDVEARKAVENFAAKELKSFSEYEEQIRAKLELLQSSERASSALNQHIEAQTAELQNKDRELEDKEKLTVQLRIENVNAQSDIKRLQEQARTIQTELEAANEELHRRLLIAEEDMKRIVTFRDIIQSMQQSNDSMAAANAELANCVHQLNEEKIETSHIFELFEMESDQNVDKLTEKLCGMKQQLGQSETQLLEKDAKMLDLQQRITDLSEQLTRAQGEEKQQAAILNQQQEELVIKNEQFAEIEQKLVEYKTVIDQMDLSESIMSGLKERVNLLESTNAAILAKCEELQQKHDKAQHKLTEQERNAASIIDELNAQLAKLQKQQLQVASADDTTLTSVYNGAGDRDAAENENSEAQIIFLNSIIADMQNKNDILKAKVEALESLPTDFTKPHAFDSISKRKPAPRVFCDICDEFDKHETEDCPVQASSDRELSPPLPIAGTSNNAEKERKLPAPRKYCESCEVFGHENGECSDETY